MRAVVSSVLLVAATRQEAAHLPPDLPLLITGIGKTAAACAVAARLARERFDLVLNVGTAGALVDHVAGLYLPGTVLNHDISADALAAMGYPVTASLPLPDGDRKVVLASGDTFVADQRTRAALATRAQLVDMEGFAVAWACREAGVPCRLVKHVSDQADEESVAWPTLVDRSARELGAWVAQHHPS